MITNKRSQELLMLATTGKPLNEDATEEEKRFYIECKHDYKVMKGTAKKHGIKNPILKYQWRLIFRGIIRSAKPPDKPEEMYPDPEPRQRDELERDLHRDYKEFRISQTEYFRLDENRLFEVSKKFKLWAK